jgi:hypothetical protein
MTFVPLLQSTVAAEMGKTWLDDRIRQGAASVVCYVPNHVWAGVLDEGSLSTITSAVGHTGCDGAESGSVTRILLGMWFGEAESSDALLGAETLGLRNRMKGGKSEITTCRVLLGFGEHLLSWLPNQVSSQSKKFQADVSERMRMAKDGTLKALESYWPYPQAVTSPTTYHALISQPSYWNLHFLGSADIGNQRYQRSTYKLRPP